MFQNSPWADVLNLAVPYVSRFTGTNGRRWYLVLRNDQLCIVCRSAVDSPEASWSAADRDAELLLAQITGELTAEVAAGPEAGTIASADMRERETVWLEGGIAVADGAGAVG